MIKLLLVFLCVLGLALSASFPSGSWVLNNLAPSTTFFVAATQFDSVLPAYTINVDGTLSSSITADWTPNATTYTSTITISGGSWSYTYYGSSQFAILGLNFDFSTSTCTLENGTYDACQLAASLSPFITGAYVAYNVTVGTSTALAICWSPFISSTTAQWGLSGKQGGCAFYN
jgi:hypothetical protein